MDQANLDNYKDKVSKHNDNEQQYRHRQNFYYKSEL